MKQLPIDQPHELVMQMTYVFQGIPYLPHYLEPIFVAPGYTNQTNGRSLTEETLIMLGAHPQLEALWPRSRRKAKKA